MTNSDEKASSNIVAEILRLARRRYAHILAVMGIFLLLGLLYLHVATYHYSVTLKVTETAPQSQSMSQVANLASAVGVSLPGTNGSPAFQLYVEAIPSRAVADAVARARPDIMHRLFADQWSESDHAWKESGSVTRALIGFVRGVIGTPAVDWHPPDGEDLEQMLGKNLDVQKTRTSPVVSITIDTPDPALGKELLLALNTATDQMLRQRVLARTEGNILYLRSELDRVTIADYREAILRVLTGEEKQEMMARSSVAFAAEPFGGPIQSSRPISPKAPSVIIMSLVLGLIAGFGLIWVQEKYWMPRRRGTILGSAPYAP